MKCSICGVWLGAAYHFLMISLCPPDVLLEVQEWRTRCVRCSTFGVGLGVAYHVLMISLCPPYVLLEVKEWRTRCEVQHFWCVAWCGIPFSYDFLMSCLCVGRGAGMENKV